MAGDTPGSVETFETWLLRRVAQAVEACEVPATLLTHLQAEIEMAREGPAARSHDVAVRQVAEVAEVDEAQARELLEAIDLKPTVTRELLMRRIAEAWLEGQRRAYLIGLDGGGTATEFTLWGRTSPARQVLRSPHGRLSNESRFSEKGLGLIPCWRFTS